MRIPIIPQNKETVKRNVLESNPNKNNIIKISKNKTDINKFLCGIYLFISSLMFLLTSISHFIINPKIMKFTIYTPLKPSSQTKKTKKSNIIANI
jgi:hypothetical protein